jgi:hypothetical protein
MALAGTSTQQLWFLNTLHTVRVRHDEGEDGISVLELLAPHGASPPLHVQPRGRVLRSRRVARTVTPAPRGSLRYEALVRATCRDVTQSATSEPRDGTAWFPVRSSTGRPTEISLHKAPQAMGKRSSRAITSHRATRQPSRLIVTSVSPHGRPGALVRFGGATR